jgi:hypothetical protein
MGDRPRSAIRSFRQAGNALDGGRSVQKAVGLGERKLMLAAERACAPHLRLGALLWSAKTSFRSAALSRAASASCEPQL